MTTKRANFIVAPSATLFPYSLLLNLQYIVQTEVPNAFRGSARDNDNKTQGATTFLAAHIVLPGAEYTSLTPTMTKGVPLSRTEPLFLFDPILRIDPLYLGDVN